MGSNLSVKLDAEMRERLNRLAETKDRSAHWLMQQAILKYVESEERFEREKAEDRERWERYVLTGEHVTHDEMTTWLTELAEAD